MSAPIKKRALQFEGNANEERSSSDDVSEEEDAQEYTGQEEIQVDFEGRNPIDSDFHGIKQLLQQLFLKAHINLSELTDLIISQNYVGSVIKNQTRGLFGVWDFQPTDDMTDSYNVSWAVTWGEGFTIKQPTTSFQTVYYFANTWRLEDKEKPNVGMSLFLHEYTHTASYYSDLSFVPDMNSSIANMYYSTNTGVYNPRAADAVYAQDLCGESFQCQYDYFLSLNRELAFTTLQYQTVYSQIRSTVSETVITCGILETPRYGRKSNFFFVPGTKVVFECNQGFVLIGDQRRTCTAAGQWDVPIYGYTECLREEEYSMRALFFTWAVIIVVIGGLLLALVCVTHHLFFRSKKRTLTTVNNRARPAELSRTSEDEELKGLKSRDTEIN